MRMLNSKNSIIFCSEFVRKKTVGNCELGITWAVMVVGIYLKAPRFSRRESKATAG